MLIRRRKLEGKRRMTHLKWHRRKKIVDLMMKLKNMASINLCHMMG